MKSSKEKLLLLSGLCWLVMGGFLLFLGSRFMIKSEGSDEIKIIFLSVALVVGFLKGRFVLIKSVKRQVNRISALSEPIFLKNIYGKGYYILIGLMMALGFSMRYLPFPQYVRGAIDIAIGIALIQGASLFFRFKKSVQGSCL